MFINPKIVIEFEKDPKDNFFCAVCGFPLNSSDDFERNKEYGCCQECYLTFAECRRKEWLAGWRPDKTVVEEYIYRRKSVVIVND